MSLEKSYTFDRSLKDDFQAVHVTGTQAVLNTKASTAAGNPQTGSNCWIQHYPGREPKVISGAEGTRSFMYDLTHQLPLVTNPSRGVTFDAKTVSTTVEASGEYFVVLADSPYDIPRALASVPDELRPSYDDAFRTLISWYQRHFPASSFSLLCFNGSIAMGHPLIVKYIPRNAEMLFAPGLINRDGRPPDTSERVARNCNVAFASQLYPQPTTPDYFDIVDHRLWAPQTVTGFKDRRRLAPNSDYSLPLEALAQKTETPFYLKQLAS